MKCGFAIRTIVPVFLVKMAGYARDIYAKGVLDELYVKCLVWKNQDKLYALLSYDLCAIDEQLTSRLKGMVDELICCCTHTHASFGGHMDTFTDYKKIMKPIFADYDQRVCDYLFEQSKKVLEEAIDNMQETSIFYVQDDLIGLGMNRNNKALMGNNKGMIYYFEQICGKKFVLTHLACHPTSLGIDNNYLSGDFVSCIQDELRMCGYDMYIYLNGCCGDISTRYTRKSTSSNERMRFAKLVKDWILEHEDCRKKVFIDCCKCKYYEFYAQLKTFDSLEVAQLKLQQAQKNLMNHMGDEDVRNYEVLVDGAKMNVFYAQADILQQSLCIPIWIYKIGIQTFVCMPVELFSELGNQLENNFVHIICYVNGYLGYVADYSAYEQNYYESFVSLFAKGEGERLIRFLKQVVD